MVHFVSNSGQITTPYCKQCLGDPHSIALLFTNRKIYLEAREVLYGSRLFSIGINQLSCIGNSSKPNTPVSYQAIPATWSTRFREHFRLMTKLNIYIHLDKAVLESSESSLLGRPDNTIATAINTAFAGEGLINGLHGANLGLQQALQVHNGNAATATLPLLPAMTLFNAQNMLGVNLAAHPVFIPLTHLPVIPPVNAGANPNGGAINAARRPSPTSQALENQKRDNVMVVRAALEELCQVLSMCGKLKEANVIYIDTAGDCSPAGLGINILRPFKTLASSIRCRIKYVPIQGRSDQNTLDDGDKPRVDGAYYQKDTTFHDTLCHLKAISFVSTVELPPGDIAEIDRQIHAL